MQQAWPEIIVEEYEGQKIDDIRRYDVDIFTVGSDWVGKFDYLNEYCKVVYLDRTEGVSSTEIRSERQTLKVGFVGDGPVLEKYLRESQYVNGMECSGELISFQGSSSFDEEYDKLPDVSDAVYLATNPEEHFSQIERALQAGVHILCESPIVKTEKELRLLQELASRHGCILMDAIKTAYATAYSRMLLLAKSGRIGRVVSVDVTCTSLAKSPALGGKKGAMDQWGPTALLPIVQLLGEEWDSESYVACFAEDDPSLDVFVKANFNYRNATGSFKIGTSVKAEGEMVVSGTEGYIYIPAPWWKTDYFEIRRENPNENKCYFYQLDGEGIRYQLVAFARAIEKKGLLPVVSWNNSRAIARMVENFSSEQFGIRLEAMPGE